MPRDLPYRAPYDWASLFAFLERRAIGGVEWCEGQAYHRTVSIGGRCGVLRIAHAPRRRSVVLTIDAALERHEVEVVRRVRRMFDLDADPAVIAAHLGRDPLLARLDRARPGIRVPGAWDPFELAVRAVAGQQVSVAAARGLLTRMAARHGERFEAEGGREAILFPAAERLAGAVLDGMPRARLETLSRLARAVASSPAAQDARDAEEASPVALKELLALRGIGPWTAGYVAMRAQGDADAFPEGDLVLRKAAGGLSARELKERAERWRPWRAYACMLLWRGEPRE